MNVAFFTDTFYPELNGVATSVMNSAVELGRKGHHVMVFAPAPAKRPTKIFKAKNVTIVRVPSIPALIYPDYRFGVLGLSKSFALLQSFHPDVIHFHTPFSIGFDALLTAKRMNCPLVGTNHVYVTKENARSLCLFPGMQHIERHVGKIALSYLNIFYNPCDLRLAPSRTLIADLHKTSSMKSFEYLPNGVQPIPRKTLSQKNINALRKKYGLKNRVVLHFGRLSKEKSVDNVIKSFAMVCREQNDVSLLIIGDGPVRPALQKLVKSLHLTKDVVFAGALPHEKLLSSGIIGLGELFVTASTMENQPMAVLEAMMYGLPIVAVREAGMIDLVSKNGFLVPTGDTHAMGQCILQILRSPKEAKVMSLHSKELAEEFTISRTTDRLISLYKTLQKKPRSAKA